MQLFRCLVGVGDVAWVVIGFKRAVSEEAPWTAIGRIEPWKNKSTGLHGVIATRVVLTDTKKEREINGDKKIETQIRSGKTRRCTCRRARAPSRRGTRSGDSKATPRFLVATTTGPLARWGRPQCRTEKCKPKCPTHHPPRIRVVINCFTKEEETRRRRRKRRRRKRRRNEGEKKEIKKEEKKEKETSEASCRATSGSLVMLAAEGVGHHVSFTSFTTSFQRPTLSAAVSYLTSKSDEAKAGCVLIKNYILFILKKMYFTLRSPPKPNPTR